MPSFELALADILVIVSYVVVIITIGLWVSRRTTTTEDYFLAGRSLTWSSSPGELHPQALTEPDVNLSIHPALIVQSYHIRLCLCHELLPTGDQRSPHG